MSAAPRRWSRLAESAWWPGAITQTAPSRTPAPRRPAKTRHLAITARAIEARGARASDSLGFIPRILIQATLPHSRPRCHEFERVNGHLSLHMHAPPSVGLPYGSYPRLVLAWLATQAVRTRSRELSLGPALSDPSVHVLCARTFLARAMGRRRETEAFLEEARAIDAEVVARLDEESLVPVSLGPA